MAGEPEGDLPNTSTDQGADEAVTLIRWVYPATPSELTIVSGDRLVFGRDPSATPQLASARMSRRHAEICQQAGAIVVHDLASKNGVFVNGVRTSEAVLHPGDVLRLGDCLGVVEESDLGSLPGPRPLGHGIFGGTAMARVLARAEQLGRERRDIWIQGEAGTGKGLLARAIHRASGRGGPFVILDGRIADDGNVEMELFGRARVADGPPSGELRAFAAAGGTLFVDELPALPLREQAVLVGIIEEAGAYPAVDRSATVAPSFGCAYGSALSLALLPAGRLDPRLRARLEAAVVDVPPLRSRRADIVPLFLAVLARYGCPAASRVAPELLERLCLRYWALNVRELDSVALRLMSRHAGEPVLKLAQLEDVLAEAELDSPSRRGSEPSPAPRRTTPSYPPEEITALRAALEQHRGNLTKAAGQLGITRAKAYRMLGRLERDHVARA